MFEIFLVISISSASLRIWEVSLIAKALRRFKRTTVIITTNKRKTIPVKTSPSSVRIALKSESIIRTVVMIDMKEVEKFLLSPSLVELFLFKVLKLNAKQTIMIKYNEIVLKKVAQTLLKTAICSDMENKEVLPINCKHCAPMIRIVAALIFLKFSSRMMLQYFDSRSPVKMISPKSIQLLTSKKYFWYEQMHCTIS